MLRKSIIVIGLCLVAIVGCGEEAAAPVDTTTSTPAPDPVAIQKARQEQERLKQEQIRLAAEAQERENKRQGIQLNINQLEQQSNLLSQKMIGRQNNISTLEGQQNQLTAELREYDGNVKSFMMDHKTAVGCMGAVGASLDDDNQYSKEAKQIAVMAGVACGLGVLFDEDFRKEVFSVADQLAQASANKKNLSSQINEVQSQLATENQSLTNEKSEYDKLVAEIQSYQSQLAAL